MKTILVFLVLGLGQVAQAKGMNRAEFMKLTHLRDGAFELVEGPESCDEGDLRIEDDEDGGVKILLGARVLVDSIGAGEQSNVEAGTDTLRETIRGEASESKVTWNKNSELGKDKYSFEAMISIHADQQPLAFTYIRKNKKNGSVSLYQKCTLEIRN